jgi:HTH-type transcriptional regulator / antitoxin HigA
MDIRPIRTGTDHRAALREIEALMGAKSGSPEGARLDVLVTLVDSYEAARFPIDPPDPIAAIEFRMEQQGLARADLEAAIGSRARVAEIMNRRRALTLPMIRKLAAQLKIPADALIGDYRLTRTRRLRKAAARRSRAPARGTRRA